MLKKPFVIYADFESILAACEDKREVQSKQYQQHIACGYSYKRVATVPKYDKAITLFRSEDSTIDVADHFVQSLLKEADEILKIMEDIVPMRLSPEQREQFRVAQTCYLCGGEFTEKNFPVRDHDHLTGEYRGAAHNMQSPVWVEALQNSRNISQSSRV